MTASTDTTSLLYRLAAILSPNDDGSLQFLPDQAEVASLTGQVQEAIPTYDLTDVEVIVIALLHSGMMVSDSIGIESLRVKDVLVRLKAKGIADVDDPTSNYAEESNVGPVATLRREFVETIRHTSQSENNMPFDSPKGYLLHWFSFVKRLYKFRENERDQHPVHGLVSERSLRGDSKSTGSERKFAEEQRLLTRRSCIGWEQFPLEVFVRQVGLDPTERNILAYLLLNELENAHSKVEDVMTLISSDVLDGYLKDRYLKPSSQLRIYELISVDDSPRRGGFRPRTEVSMRPAVRHYLLTGEGVIAGINDTDDDTPYRSASESINDWLRYVTLRQKITRISDDDHRADGDEDRPAFERMPDADTKTHPLLQKMLVRIRRKEAISGEVFPLSWLVEEHSLTETERDILLVLLDAAMTGRSLDRDDVARSLTLNPLERLEIEGLLDAESKLVQQDLVRPVARRRSSSEIELDTNIRNFLLGHAELHRATVKDLISSFPLLSHTMPQFTLDDLVVTDSVMTVLRDTVHMIEINADETLCRWGLLSRQLSRQDSDCIGATTILLSGLSGVGKTYAAHCLCGSLGKAIVTTDCSRLLSFYVGESEQNVSKLFDSYETILKRTGKDFPVLLLNEVDQFFGKRSAGTGHSVDRMYNQMMNLFLERLESFSGILVATTNLIDLIDDAMSRRFSVKVTLGMPDASARFDLWNLHLPSDVPLANDVDLGTLADQFEFSGGQIAVAVKNAAMTAAIRGDMIRMADLVAACKAEDEGAFDSRSTSRKRQVGFCAEPELRMQERVRSGR